jgi:xanthine dehydrogenase accessory factor
VNETQRWLDGAREALAKGEAAALATVVQVQGSAYRREGSRLLVRPGGSQVGAVSGGCLEGEVVQAVPEILASGQARVLRFDTTGDEDAVFGYGSGCSGVVDILVEPLHSASAALYVQTCWAVDQSRQPAVVLTATAGPLTGQRAIWQAGAWRGPLVDELSPGARRSAEASLSSTISGPVVLTTAQGEVPACLDVLRPPIELLIFGGDEDAAVLARLAHELGWALSVFDFRPRLLDPARFPPGTRLIESGGEALPHRLKPGPATAALVASRHYLYDVAALRALLQAPPPYIGVMGSAIRLERLLNEVRPSPAQLARLHAPVGLDLGARTPAEIALSIVSEVLAVFTGHSATSLAQSRERSSAAD